MPTRNANGEPPVTIRTLYELVQGLDKKVDQHSELLAVMAHQLNAPPSVCPRNPDLLAALKRFDDIVNAVENHEQRLVGIERAMVIIAALGGILVTMLGKIAYDLVTGAAHLSW